MPLSADTDPRIQQVENNATIAMVVLAASVVYHGAYLSRDTATGAVKPFDGTSADRGVGWHFGDKVTGLAAGPGVVRPDAKVLKGGFIWQGLAVAGLAGDDTDLGAPVWATDDGTYTIVDPSTSGHEVGEVVGSEDGVVADVYMKNQLGWVE